MPFNLGGNPGQNPRAKIGPFRLYARLSTLTRGSVTRFRSTNEIMLYIGWHDGIPTSKKYSTNLHASTTSGPPPEARQKNTTTKGSLCFPINPRMVQSISAVFPPCVLALAPASRRSTAHTRPTTPTARCVTPASSHPCTSLQQGSDGAGASIYSTPWVPAIPA